MSTVKDVMIKVIRDQPEDSDFDEILRELAFVKMVNRGLADSDSGRTVPHEEMMISQEVHFSHEGTKARRKA